MKSIISFHFILLWFWCYCQVSIFVPTGNNFGKSKNGTGYWQQGCQWLKFGKRRCNWRIASAPNHRFSNNHRVFKSNYGFDGFSVWNDQEFHIVSMMKNIGLQYAVWKPLIHSKFHWKYFLYFQWSCRNCHCYWCSSYSDRCSQTFDWNIHKIEVGSIFIRTKYISNI